MRRSGLLLHISSLPSPGGIGTLGKAAYDFVDFLKASGTAIWQMLPVNPTSYGDSPYQSFSTFAGNPYFIDLPTLETDGLLEPSDYLPLVRDDLSVDYEYLYRTRPVILHRAFTKGGNALQSDIDAFSRQNPWLDDYALFLALKDHFNGLPWTEWDEDIRLRKPEAVAGWRSQLFEEIRYHRFVQFLFFRQWEALRDYAHRQGILLMGDLPIYVALDSSDVWTSPDAFLLGEDKRPAEVAGVPPDYFSEFGQLWGNPLYNWDAMKRDGFSWWIARLGATAKLFDMVRLDHFIGFANYYAIPAFSPDARVGEWRLGPGIALFEKIRQKLPQLTIIAEDLGVVSPRVQALLKKTGFPGMKVLDFAFGSDRDNWNLPHNLKQNCVLYTGTHDNDPILGWWEGAGEEERAFTLEYLGLDDDSTLCDTMIRAAFLSVADTVIVPMQDYLELGREARMNCPGTLGGNWQWRMRDGAANAGLAERILSLNESADRV